MTKKVNLDEFDYSELQALITEAHEKSKQKRAENLAAAVDAVKLELGKRGFTLDDLLSQIGATNTAIAGKSSRKPRDDAGRKVAPKYRDPENPENTWAGRGIKPKWLSEKLAGGAKLDSFIIQS